MKRDMDYIRDLLIKIEEANEPLDFSDCILVEETREKVEYHLWLLNEIGYIDAVFQYADNHLYYCSIKGLTWAGQDFLDTMKSNKVWEKSKQIIRKTLGTTTFELIRRTCFMVSEQMLKNSILHE